VRSAGLSLWGRVHTGAVSADLTIGEFSRITHLSIKALRRYHQAGLLEPVQVDPQTGYRYYSLPQVPTAQVIHRFRQLGMPERQVGQLVAVADPGARSALIAQHLERLENELEETRAAVVALRRLLRPDPPPLEVRHRRVETTTVAAITDVVDLGDVLAWYDRAMGELDRVLSAAAAVPTGPPGGLYDNELFSEERGRVVLYRPVDSPPDRGAVHFLEIPAADLATTVHRGAHDDIDVTYAALGTYLSEQALQVAGPVREIYHVGPRDNDDPSTWRTEIAWPIFQTTARHR
jgi:DNA-binding transcriptional MerR regulator